MATQAQIDALKRERDELARKFNAAQDELRAERKAAEVLRADTENHRQARVSAEQKSEALRSELDSLPDAVKEVVAQHAGPRADQPRWMFRGDDPEGEGKVFPDLASAEAAQKAEPNVWHEKQYDARQAYAVRQVTVDTETDTDTFSLREEDD